MDETGSNLAMTRRYARSPQASRAYNHAPDGRGQNVTLIRAMALRGLVGEITFPGATDAFAFKTYVTQVLVPNLWRGACVIMDNLPAHKVKGKRASNWIGRRDSHLFVPLFTRFLANWKLLVKG